MANTGSAGGTWNVEGDKVAASLCNVDYSVEITSTALNELQYPGVPVAGEVGTICFWYRRGASTGDLGFCAGAHSGTAYSGYLIAPNTANTGLLLGIGQGSGTPSDTTRFFTIYSNTGWDTDPLFTTQEWIHIAAVFGLGGTDNRPTTCYLDGVAQNNVVTNTGSETVAGFATGARIGPGNWQNSSSIPAGANGARYADIRIYNRQLSSAEVLTVATNEG